MSRAFPALKQFALRLWFLVPSPLPRGAQEFDAFCESIVRIGNFPDTDSYRHAIAVMIQHLKPTENRKSKAWFIRCMHKAQANEVAFGKIQEMKEKEKSALATFKAQAAKETNVIPISNESVQGASDGVVPTA